MLNTTFLSLVLKLMKAGPIYTTNSSSSSSRINYTGSTQRNGSTATTNLAASMNILSLQARVVAATVLAMMLRYATFLQPPTIRAREEHILPSIVMLLKESSSGGGNAKSELLVKFRRRAVAALGETVFYITAQEEEDEQQTHQQQLGGNDGGNNNDRWVLSNQAVDALVDCLQDEADEIVKHYAAKVRQSRLKIYEWNRITLNKCVSITLISTAVNILYSNNNNSNNHQSYTFCNRRLRMYLHKAEWNLKNALFPMISQ